MKQHNRYGRALCALLAMLVLWATALPAAGLVPDYTPSAAYQSSTYYKNLRALPTTGDAAFDAVAIALSQLSYHEGNGTAQMGGESSGGGNFTEYNYAFGKIGGSYGYAWCAAFVSWCLDLAGAPDSAGGAFASCTLWVEKLKSIGQYRTRSSGYTPKAGDLIFFRTAGVSRASDHVGLVRYVKGGRVYTVEGNTSNRVDLHDYALGDSYIVGYGLPDYTGQRVKIDRLAANGKDGGYYVVSYSFVNVRAGRSADSVRLGELKRGRLVKVDEVKNGWGRIEYSGKTGYISLEYADFVTPTRHTARYMSEGKTLHEAAYYSTEKAVVSALTPEREGYVFLYWQDSSGNIMRTGDRLGSADTVLTAVFEKLPEPEYPPESQAPMTPPEAPEGGDIPQDGSQDPPMGEEVAPPKYDTNATPRAPQAQGNIAAARHAGVVSALLALLLGGVWIALQKKNEN